MVDGVAFSVFKTERFMVIHVTHYCYDGGI
jgi:hypothetical protein